MTACRALVLLLLTLLCVGQPASAPVYEIRGVALNHLTNEPIRKALVRLTPINGPGQLTFVTAEDGRFEFLNIPKGKYRLMAQRRGYFEHAFHENGQYSTAVVVGPGLDATNIVFPLVAPSSIQGTVVDEDATPIVGATVWVFREMVNEGEKKVVQMGNYQTDSAGLFHIRRITAGTYFVAVQAGNPQIENATTYPVTFSGDTTEASGAQPILVSEGQSAQVHIAMRPAPNIHIPIAAAGRRPDTPMPQLFVRGPGNVLIPVGSSIGSSDGHSEITGLPAGRYLARVITGGQRFYNDSGLEEVEAADGVPLALTSSTAGPSISGTVTFEGGASTNHLPLMLVNPDNQTSVGVPVQKDGTLGVPGSPIAPGSYLIALASDEYYVKSIAVQGARFAADRIELTENCYAKISVIAAPRTSMSQLDGFALRNNSPIAGAMVLLVPHDPNRGILYRRDQTDSDGSFTLPAIQPGQYTLVAIDDEGRGLLYKDAAVITPYLAVGQTIDFPRRSNAAVKISVQPRLP